MSRTPPINDQHPSSTLTEPFTDATVSTARLSELGRLEGRYRVFDALTLGVIAELEASFGRVAGLPANTKARFVIHARRRRTDRLERARARDAIRRQHETRRKEIAAGERPPLRESDPQFCDIHGIQFQKGAGRTRPTKEVQQ